MQNRCSLSFAVAAVCSLPLAAQEPPRAQEPPPAAVETPVGPAHEAWVPDSQPKDVRWTLWLPYDAADGALLDHTLHLSDLQRRHAAAGLRINVVLDTASAKIAAARKPGFAVWSLQPPPAEPAQQPETDVQVEQVVIDDLGFGGSTFGWQASYFCRGQELRRVLPSLDLFTDVVAPALADEAKLPENDEAAAVVFSLLQSVGDAYVDAQQIPPLIAALPHSGHARALAVLQQWWGSGDYEAADAAIEAGLQALAGEPISLCVFADLVLRGDRSDRFARRLAAELGPVAAAAPEGPFTQLVYLRTLLRAGQDRLAGRVIAKLQKSLKRPQDLLLFSETLLEGSTPAAQRDQAQQALDKARAGGADARLCFAAQHKIQQRCGDAEAAAQTMLRYRTDVGEGRDLNNDAWYLMVRPDTMGRFDTLALAQCDELMRQMGAGISHGNQDTVALAKFLNGLVDEAIELQADASRASGDQPPYVARLLRFKNAKARAKAAAAAPK